MQDDEGVQHRCEFWGADPLFTLLLYDFVKQSCISFVESSSRVSFYDWRPSVLLIMILSVNNIWHTAWVAFVKSQASTAVDAPGISVLPRVGDAVLWRNLTDDGEPDLSLGRAPGGIPSALQLRRGNPESLPWPQPKEGASWRGCAKTMSETGALDQQISTGSWCGISKHAICAFTFRGRGHECLGGRSALLVECDFSMAAGTPCILPPENVLATTYAQTCPNDIWWLSGDLFIYDILIESYNRHAEMMLSPQPTATQPPRQKQAQPEPSSSSASQFLDWTKLSVKRLGSWHRINPPGLISWPCYLNVILMMP